MARWRQEYRYRLHYRHHPSQQTQPKHSQKTLSTWSTNTNPTALWVSQVGLSRSWVTMKEEAGVRGTNSLLRDRFNCLNLNETEEYENVVAQVLVCMFMWAGVLNYRSPGCTGNYRPVDWVFNKNPPTHLCSSVCANVNSKLW